MRRVLALSVAAVLAVTVVVGVDLARDDGDGVERFPVGPVGDSGVAAAGALLAGFDSCEDLADELAVRAANTGHFGFGEQMFAVDDMVMEESMDMAMTDAAAGAPAPEPAPQSATGTTTAAVSAGSAGGAVGADGDAARLTADGTTDTNVAVAGIDEPDLVETDGRRLFSVVNEQELVVADVVADTPTVLARVPLDEFGWSQILLVGDRLLLVGQMWGVGAFGDDIAGRGFAPQTGMTRLALFDVAGDVPVRVGTTDVEGQLVTARGVGPIVHLVSQHWPNPAIDPRKWDTLAASPDPQEALVAALRDVPGESWLPRVDVDGEVSTLPCDRVGFIPESRDAALLSVHTFDIADGLRPTGQTAIVSDGQNVHATADRLVVATTLWPQWNEFPVAPLPMVDEPLPNPTFQDEEAAIEADRAAAAEAAAAAAAAAAKPQVPSTVLHLFQIDAGGATHLASGATPGTLVNQFAMSWHEDHLRVATTIEDWNGGAPSVSELATFAVEGDRLVERGRVGNLGVTEVIQSVRYLGDTAHVVTFRQTDPLYVIDLQDPTNPTVRGELKITGFSSYLHPLPDDRLLGIGQEATEDGITVGLQVQVFDVSDPTAPIRTDQIVLPNANSPAEWDHLAVTLHDGRLFLPYHQWGGFGDVVFEEEVATEAVDGDVPAGTSAPAPGPEGFDAGVLVVDVDGDDLTEVARLRTADRQEVVRTLVVDGNAVTVGWGGIDVWSPSLDLVASLR